MNYASANGPGHPCGSPGLGLLFRTLPPLTRTLVGVVGLVLAAGCGKAPPPPEPVPPPRPPPVVRMVEPRAPAPAAEPVAEPIAESGGEPAAEAVAEPVSKPIAEPLARPVSEPATKPPSKPVVPQVALSPVNIPKAPLDEGFAYRNERIRTGPWSVNLVKVDRSRSDLRLTTTLGRGGLLGLGTLTDQIDALPAELGSPVVAINGDFYRTEHEPYAGDPRGLQIFNGELVSAPIGQPAFWIDAEGAPHMDHVASRFQVTWPNGETLRIGLNEERRSNSAILYTHRMGSSTDARGGREFILVPPGENEWPPLRIGETYTAEVRKVVNGGNSRLSSKTMVLSIGPTLLARVPQVKAGDILKISTATAPDLRGAQTALGGGPVLLHDGKLQATYEHRGDERHPRTAFGWNDQYYFFAQVDGRQRGFSVGMTLRELATYLAKQGCHEAINLDGGGSAEMWVEGEVVNRPCFGRERSTANGLVLLRRNGVAAQ